MRHKLVLWFVLLINGFLVGFILQYAKLQRSQKELSASTKQLRSCQSSEQLSQWLVARANLLNSGWRNIAISLIDLDFGEVKAQACVIAFHEKAGRSQVDLVLAS